MTSDHKMVQLPFGRMKLFHEEILVMILTRVLDGFLHIVLYDEQVALGKPLPCSDAS